MNARLVWFGLILLPTVGLAQNDAFYRDQAQRQKAFAVKLIKIPEVRRDLALTSEQATAIDLQLKEYKERYTLLSKRFDTNSQDHGSSFEAVKALDDVDRDIEKRVFNALNPDQKIRLRALQYQALGFESLYEKDLQKTLALTKDQVKKVETFRKDQADRVSKAINSMGAQYSAEMLADAVNRLQAEGEKNILEILDESQREKYRVVLGTRLSSITKLTQFGG